jgi:hypothetical protein
MNKTVAENDQAAYIFGQEAEVVLKNKAYTFAITAMKGDIVAKLAIDPLLGDNESTIELVRKLQCITELENQLEKVMRLGKFAENEITARNQNKQRNKR